MAKRRKPTEIVPSSEAGYGSLLTSISDLLDHARRMSARTVNNILTATYWEIGRRIVEHEQGGEARAEYGRNCWNGLRQGSDGEARPWLFEVQSLQMRAFYLGWEICQTPSENSRHGRNCPRMWGEATRYCRHRRQYRREAIAQTLSAESQLAPSAIASPAAPCRCFPLSWSHYVRLMSVEKPHARAFYEAEAIRGGWSVRQLDRQIGTQFFERTSHSKQQAAMLARGQRPKPEDAVSVQDEVRDPYLLEFLDLKDEYSESDLEEALFDTWKRSCWNWARASPSSPGRNAFASGRNGIAIDLLLFHRRLRCLVVIDLKIGKFTHADAGQMSLYLNYVQEHMKEPGENDPVGLILCSDKNDAVVHYAMGGIKAKVFASHYLTDLPDPETLRQEILETKHALETASGPTRTTQWLNYPGNRGTRS